MDTPFEFNDKNSRIVYVKAVDANELPAEIKAGMGAIDQLYAVHDADGQRLALVADRRLAFALARQHDFAPVTVH